MGSGRTSKRLDDYNFLNVDYIKIDVEGHELKVIKGAIATIEKYNPVIVIEENGSQELYNKGVKDDALNFLQSINYKVMLLKNRSVRYNISEVIWKNNNY